ncbi:hypothetical protein RUND412_005183 [Rhizina undulata]
MATSDPLVDLLTPHFPPEAPTPSPAVLNTYLLRLSSLGLDSLLTTEPSSLTSSLQSVNLSLQALSSRSHKPLIASSHHLSTLSTSISRLSSSLSNLKSQIPELDSKIANFTTQFSRDSECLQRRQKTQLLARELDRVLDILQLPSLLQSIISQGSYPTALDLMSNVRRLLILYPNSVTVNAVAKECEGLQRGMVSSLLGTLRGPLKLPVAMKTVGFLRRCEYSSSASQSSMDERALRGLFLVCRRSYLMSLLDALEPLRALADEEMGTGSGVQTERYLKRWVEVFREQSFGIVGMYKSIFPNALPITSTPGSSSSPAVIPTSFTPPLASPSHDSRPATPIRSRSSSTISATAVQPADDDPENGNSPDPVAGFTLHLVGMLREVLERYLKNVEDRSVRESLLTQVLYAAGSMGRLGGEFGGLLGMMELVEEGEEGEEWVGVVAKQRVLASRIESLAGGGRG